MFNSRENVKFRIEVVRQSLQGTEHEQAAIVNGKT